jgi:hypothetical protein
LQERCLACLKSKTEMKQSLNDIYNILDMIVQVRPRISFFFRERERERERESNRIYIISQLAYSVHFLYKAIKVTNREMQRVGSPAQIESCIEILQRVGI